MKHSTLHMTFVAWVAAGLLLLPLGCASMPDDVELERPSMLPSVSDSAPHGHVQSSMLPSVSAKSIDALKKENEFLRSELISVWDTLAQAEQARTENQEASQQVIADLQAQVGEFQVVMQAQDESIKKAKRTLRNLNRSVTKQGKILQEIGRRSTRADPGPIPAPSSGAFTPPKTSQPPPKASQLVVPEETILSALPTVDLNTASAAALVRGLSLTRQEAKEIITHRPYKRIGELVSMNVIPKATFDRIRKQLVISTPSK